MEAAVPVNGLAPADATHAAPISAMLAVWVGPELPWMMSATLRATALPIMAEGMPVRGGAAKIGMPLRLVWGRETGCGCAKALPMAKIFGYIGLT